MQTAATSHAALTASPRLSATIAHETAPSTATAVHNSFVCHAIELLKVGAIDFLLHFKQSLNWLAFGNITTSRLGWKLGATLMSLQSRGSEIWHDRLRYGQGGLTHKKGVRILGADRLRQRPFRRSRQHRKALDGNLGHRRLEDPDALDGVPGHREGTRILDANVHFQRLAAVDQVEALDRVSSLMCGVPNPSTNVLSSSPTVSTTSVSPSLQACSAMTATDFSALRSLAACTSGGQRLSS